MWRPIGEQRVVSTAPLIGGPVGPTQCSAPRIPGQLGNFWQYYNTGCSFSSIPQKPPAAGAE